MKTPRSIAAACLIALLSAGSVHAQVMPAPPAPPSYIDERAGITLSEAIVRAREREPTLRAGREDIDVAEGQRQQAALRPNPAVSFERRIEPRGTDSQTTLGLTWPMDLFRRTSRVRAADQEVAVVTLTVADRERLLARDVRVQYGSVAASVRDLSLADEMAATLERQLDVLRSRATEGTIAPLERDLLEVEVRRLQIERVRAAGRADVAMVRLKQLLGMRPDEALTLAQDLNTLVTTATALPAGQALGARPDVLEADARVTLADRKVDQVKSEGRIDVSLFGTYMRMDAGFPQQGFSSFGTLERVRGRFNYIVGGAMVDLPLFNRRQGDAASAMAGKRGAEAHRDAVALSAAADVAAARARDLRAREVMQLYSGGTWELARRNLDVMRQTFELGRATASDVLTEQRRYLEFEQARTDALREAWDAHVAFMVAIGEYK
jgi:cobalt-zinc-cadmium efflux system outer membrane protein